MALSCTRQFAQSAEQQFAQFYRVLTGSDQFPARFTGEAARLAATARQLTLLSGQLSTGRQVAKTTKQIETAEKLLSREYKALVKDLS